MVKDGVKAILIFAPTYITILLEIKLYNVYL